MKSAGLAFAGLAGRPEPTAEIGGARERVILNAVSNTVNKNGFQPVPATYTIRVRQFQTNVRIGPFFLPLYNASL